MQVSNKSSYIASIYSAIVLNTDTNQDPKGLGRVQIYIPSMNFEYADKYEEYMGSQDKSNSEYINIFPWAYTIKDGLKVGDEVYGSFIDSDNSSHIVLGQKGGVSTANNSTNGLGGIVGNTGDLVNLAMAIIMHNEIGVDVSAWGSNSIPDSKYGSITLHDGGEYSKLLQRWIKQRWLVYWSNSMA